MIRHRRPICLKIRLDRTHSSLFEFRDTRPTWVAIQTLKGRMSLAQGAEAHVSLPHERLQECIGLVRERRAKMPESGLGGDRRAEFLASQRSIGKSLSRRLRRGDVFAIFELLD